MLINRIYTYLAMAGGFIVTLLVAFMRGKSQGKQQAEAKQNEAIIDNVAKKQQVQNNVAAMSDDDRRDELFRDFTRK
jgi:hypothetical protein